LDKRKYFYFSRVSQELIIASLFITKAILTIKNKKILFTHFPPVKPSQILQAQFGSQAHKPAMLILL